MKSNFIKVASETKICLEQIKPLFEQYDSEVNYDLFLIDKTCKDLELYLPNLISSYEEYKLVTCKEDEYISKLYNLIFQIQEKFILAHDLNCLSGITKNIDELILYFTLKN